MSDCTHEEKISSKVLLKMVAVATSHTLLRFWFKALIALMTAVPPLSFYKIRVDFQTSKVFTVNSRFQWFYRLYLAIASFCTKTNAWIEFSCVLRLMLNVTIFWLIASGHYLSLISPSFRNFSLILSKDLSWYKSRRLRKIHFRFPTRRIKLMVKWLLYFVKVNVGIGRQGLITNHRP